MQGLASGLGLGHPVTSPSFALIKEYRDGLPLYHFDAYRIRSAAEFVELGYEEYFYGDGVSVVEWGNKVRGLLPKEYLEIRFSRGEQDTRELELTAHGERWSELLRGLTARRSKAKG